MLTFSQAMHAPKANEAIQLKSVILCKLLQIHTGFTVLDLIQGVRFFETILKAFCLPKATFNSTALLGCKY